MPRVKQFDPTLVVERAMELFWEKGYEATSIQDLVDRTGVNRFSMYDAFGSKHGLFVAALDRYSALISDTMLRDLEMDRGGRAAIERYFARAVDLYGGPQGWRGCLMTNCAVELAQRDRVARARVAAHFRRVETALAGAARRAVQRGETAGRIPPARLARYLLGCLYGLAAVARTRPGRRALEQYVAVVLSVL